MSRSQGTGSPLFFMCHRKRMNRWGYWHRSSTGEMVQDNEPGHDKIVRTGRTKPRQRGIYTGAPGLRSLLESHEYRCECGYVGWTNHMDILHYPVAE